MNRIRRSSSKDVEEAMAGGLNKVIKITDRRTDGRIKYSICRSRLAPDNILTLFENPSETAFS